MRRRRVRGRDAAALLVAVLALVGLAWLAPAVAQQPYTVAVDEFEPTEFDPPAPPPFPTGTTIVWENDGDIPHQIKAEGLFESYVLDPDQDSPQNRFSYTFSQSGTFNYVCLLHPDKKGTIRIAGGLPPDTFPPPTNIDSGPPNPDTADSATFAFSSPEEGSTFQCSLDGSPFASCASPKTYPGLAEGTHTFRVRARDKVGNIDPTPAESTWTIQFPKPEQTILPGGAPPGGPEAPGGADTSPPETTITGGPSGTVGIGPVTFTFASSEAGSRFECRLDRSALSGCTSPKTFSRPATGAHTFEVRAIDAAGNADPTMARRAFSVAPGAPTPPSPPPAPPPEVAPPPPATAASTPVTVEAGMVRDLQVAPQVLSPGELVTVRGGFDLDLDGDIDDADLALVEQRLQGCCVITLDGTPLGDPIRLLAGQTRFEEARVIPEASAFGHHVLGLATVSTPPVVLANLDLEVLVPAPARGASRMDQWLPWLYLGLAWALLLVGVLFVVAGRRRPPRLPPRERPRAVPTPEAGDSKPPEAAPKEAGEPEQPEEVAEPKPGEVPAPAGVGSRATRDAGGRRAKPKPEPAATRSRGSTTGSGSGSRARKPAAKPSPSRSGRDSTS